MTNARRTLNVFILFLILGGLTVSAQQPQTPPATAAGQQPPPPGSRPPPRVPPPDRVPSSATGMWLAKRFRP